MNICWVTLPSYSAYGCVGFGIMASDGFFGKIPEQRKAGDIFYNSSHFVILIKKLSSRKYEIAEGNY